jgi:hypothetical protein
MLCALVRNNLVVDVLDLSLPQIDMVGNIYEAVIDVSAMSPQPQYGWTFDGSNLLPPGWHITRLAMRQRFTVGELLGIMTYVNSNPNSIVAMLMQNLQLATFIDLQRSDTISGMGVLVSYGLLTSQRSTTILTTPPTIQEVYVA